MITFTADSVIIDNQSAGFEDLYQASKNAGNGMITKLSTTYTINGSVLLQNNATLQDASKTVNINGLLFHIPSGCKLILGTKLSSTSISGGCTVNMPNVIPEFGFGGLDPTDSGDLMLYGGTINIYCYWSFFSGNNFVELLKATIDGYGKVSGSTSSVSYCTFKRVHSNYGTLLYKGTIAKYYQNTVTAVSNGDIDPNLPELDTVFTIDKFTGDGNMDIFYGEYYGYSKLIGVIDDTFTKTIILYGTIVSNGYGFNRLNPNKNDFYHKFRFKPRLQSDNGMMLANIPVTITNRLGEVEFSGTTDMLGYIDIWATYYRDQAGLSDGEIMTPHTVNITLGETVLSSTITIDRNMEDFPFVIQTQQPAISGSDILSAIDVYRTGCDASLLSIHADLKSLILAMGDKVQATQTTITRQGMKITL